MKRVTCLIALALALVLPAAALAGPWADTWADACEVSYPPGTTGELGCLIEVTPPPPPPPGAVAITLDNAGADTLRAVEFPSEVRFDVCAAWSADSVTSTLTMVEIDYARGGNADDRSLLAMSLNKVGGQTFLSLDWSPVAKTGTSLLSFKPWIFGASPVATIPVNECKDPKTLGTPVEVIANGTGVSVSVGAQSLHLPSAIPGDMTLTTEVVRFYPFVFDNAEGAVARMYWRFRQSAY